MASRYYPQKDINTFDKFNKELVGNLVAFSYFLEPIPGCWFAAYVKSTVDPTLQ